MKFLLIAILFLTCAQINAQENEEFLFLLVDEMPVFPGGSKELSRYLVNKIIYPEGARKANEQGVVYITFNVNKEGRVINTRVARGICPLLDKEALRLVEEMPNWIPARVQNVSVDFVQTLPRFEL